MPVCVSDPAGEAPGNSRHLDTAGLVIGGELRPLTQAQFPVGVRGSFSHPWRKGLGSDYLMVLKTCLTQAMANFLTL